MQRLRDKAGVTEIMVAAVRVNKGERELEGMKLEGNQRLEHVGYCRTLEFVLRRF